MRRKKKLVKKAGRRRAQRSRARLSGTKKYAIAKAHLGGIAASFLASEFKISQLSIYLWAKQVKKAKGKNPFDGAGGFTPKQARLLALARKAK